MNALKQPTPYSDDSGLVVGAEQSYGLILAAQLRYSRAAAEHGRLWPANRNIGAASITTVFFLIAL